MIGLISKVKTRSYALLGCYTNFTFLKGASHPDEMVTTAAKLGWSTVGIADVNSLAGIVRAHVAARDNHIRLLVGARLRLVDGPDVLVHPCDREGYEGLSILLSEANMRGSRRLRCFILPILPVCQKVRHCWSCLRAIQMPVIRRIYVKSERLPRVSYLPASAFTGMVLMRRDARYLVNLPLLWASRGCRCKCAVSCSCTSPSCRCAGLHS